ncbi:MAG: exodeoxyribonuclease VII large subunit [Spirochaetota bacterium]
MSDTSVRPLTVAELTRRIKDRLENAFPMVAVEGELSNVRPSSTGHLYFTLKDDEAALSAVLFRGRARGVDFAPEDGQQVVAYGSIGVYAKRGSYQIIVERMELAGIGRILAMLEERKRRLAAEGLFSAERKRRLPLLPQRIAVVTSPTGAALRDIVQVLGRRNAGIDLVVCPTPVQGDQAAARIAKMIRIASTHRLGDVLIVGRGGGSLEDLLPFSDEEVVRAIAECEIPVISAVGHEIDWALSDYAADLRAPTPSAAAEVVAASREELVARVHELGRSIVNRFVDRYRRGRMLLHQFSPEELHRSYWMLAQPTLQEFDRVREEMIDAMDDRIATERHRLELASRELSSVSPYQVVRRGYAIVRDASGTIVSDVAAVRPKDPLAVELRTGVVDTTVENVRIGGSEHEEL